MYSVGSKRSAAAANLTTATSKGATSFACPYTKNSYAAASGSSKVKRRKQEHGYMQVPRVFRCVPLIEDIDEIISKLNTLVVDCTQYVPKLIMDSREHNKEMISTFQRLHPRLRQDTTLECSDFILTLDTLLAYPIERKSLGDASSSVSDNRSTKQSANMSLLFEEMRSDPSKKSRVIQLYEKMDHNFVGTSDTIHNDCTPPDDCWAFLGDIDDYDGQRLSRRNLFGSMLNKVVAHDFRILISESPLHTCFLILLLMWKCHEHGDKINFKGQKPLDLTALSKAHLLLNAEQQATYIETRDLPSVKTEPLLDTVPHEHMQFFKELLVVPKLTIGYAYAIFQKFRGKRALACYLEKHANNPTAVLKELRELVSADPRDPPSKKKRKMGPKLALKLFNDYHTTRYTDKGTKAVLLASNDGDDDDDNKLEDEEACSDNEEKDEIKAGVYNAVGDGDDDDKIVF